MLVDVLAEPTCDRHIRLAFRARSRVALMPAAELGTQSVDGVAALRIAARMSS